MRLSTIIRNLSKNLDFCLCNISSTIENLSEAIDNEIIKYQIELINKIARDYNLNKDELYQKYIKNKNIKNTDIDENYDNICNQILERIDIGSTEYYFEKKDHGKVYTKDGKTVGEYKDGTIIFIAK